MPNRSNNMVMLQLHWLGYSWSTKSIYTLYAIVGYPSTKVSIIEPPGHCNVNEWHPVPHRLLFMWLSHAVKFEKIGVQFGNWATTQCDAYLWSIGLNKAMERLCMPCEGNMNYVPITLSYAKPKPWQTVTSLDVIIEAPMHLLFLGTRKSIMDINKKYMKGH